MQVLCVSGRFATSTTALVAATVVSVGVLGISPAPTPHRLAAQLTSAAHVAAGTVQHAETALRDGLEATGPTVASLLASSPTVLSTTSVHQLAAVATTPAAIAPLLAAGAVTGAAPVASVSQLLAADAISGLPTLNPADADAVFAAVAALINQFAQSLLTTPTAIRVAIERVAQGDVNGAFASLEGLVILPLVKFAASPDLQRAADAISRYLPSQLANAVTAAPTILQFQGARTIDLYTSARRSVVDAVQGVISSLGTLNPVAIAGAVASGLGNVINTAVANTFGDNGAFAIAHDVVAGLISAAFPDGGSNTGTTVVRTAVTTRALSVTTSAQSVTGITQSSPSRSIPAASTTADDTFSVPGASVPTGAAAESNTSAAPKVTARSATAGSATKDDSARAHPTAGKAKTDITAAPTETVDVTSGNKVEPKATADASAAPRSTSVKESSNATAASSAKDSPTTASSATFTARSPSNGSSSSPSPPS